jgi:hypothetical protein
VSGLRYLELASPTARISPECSASRRVLAVLLSFIGRDAQAPDGMTQSKSDRRNIVGGDGNEWLVREFENVCLEATSKSLVFERAEVVRRVRDYPGNWASLSDDQLYRLSLRT